MPELPEVETTVNDLRKKLVGLRFKDVWTDWPKTFKKSGGFENFKKTIKNKKISNITRRAKFIVVDIEGKPGSRFFKSAKRNSQRQLKNSLPGKYSIFIHQKISGHLLYGKWTMKNGKWEAKGEGPLRDERENQYIRTIWLLSNGYQLAFSDLRRFGKVVLVKDGDLSELPEIKDLGPEPLELDFKKFASLFKPARPSAGWAGRRKKGRIKQVLMDPFFIVGIGNIYADEILWDSGLHPLSRVENLSSADLNKIFSSTVKILKKAIKLGGSSVEDYRMPSGEKGEYQNQTKAYQHEGEECSRNDGGIIKRIKLGGRSAHFCPKHQKLK